MSFNFPFDPLAFNKLPFLYYNPYFQAMYQVPLMCPVYTQGINNDNCIVIEDDEACQQSGSSTQETPVTQFKEEDIHLKVSVYRQHQNNNARSYVIQEDVLLGAQSQSQEICVGRRGCEIALPFGERNVEKVHCKILTSQGFLVSSHLTKEMVLFLSSEFAHGLPRNIITLLHQMAKQPPRFLLEDKGGSFCRVKREPMSMNSYLIGADTQFKVLSMKQKTAGKDRQYLLQALMKEANKNHKIHGLDEDTAAELQRLTQSTRKCKGRQQLLSQCQEAFLKIQFNHDHSVHIFVAQSVQQFRIGRAQDCNVMIQINTVSRKQALIEYVDDQWTIQDGEVGRESANGTWLSLPKSQPTEIQNNMEVKISENIIKFEFVNLNKKRKLNHLLI